jgi:hypothetical protein
MSGVIRKADKPYYSAKDVMDLLDVSRSKAYQIVSALRGECIDEKLITPKYPAGKVPKRYLEQKLMIE